MSTNIKIYQEVFNETWFLQNFYNSLQSLVFGQTFYAINEVVSEDSPRLEKADIKVTGILQNRNKHINATPIVTSLPNLTLHSWINIYVLPMSPV